MPKLNENKTNMADVIQDVGYFNVKDELVFVDENFCINLVEEEVVSEPLENKFIVFDSVSSDVTSKYDGLATA
ncbi:hypothetical protein J6590_073453 [Homalodisca vitripennis]|nr:hypothetical protein J6590_073453 [Homalodisca vitripennis]